MVKIPVLRDKIVSLGGAKVVKFLHMGMQLTSQLECVDVCVGVKFLEIGVVCYGVHTVVLLLGGNSCSGVPMSTHVNS